MPSASENSRPFPVTRYAHVDAALEDIAKMDWTSADDHELARIARAHRNAVRSAEIENSFQEPDETALFDALHQMRCPQDIRTIAVAAYWKHRKAMKC